MGDLHDHIPITLTMADGSEGPTLALRCDGTTIYIEGNGVEAVSSVHCERAAIDAWLVAIGGSPQYPCPEHGHG